MLFPTDDPGVDPLRSSRPTLLHNLEEIAGRDARHQAAGALGRVIRSHGNGLVFDDQTKRVSFRQLRQRVHLQSASLCREDGHLDVSGAPRSGIQLIQPGIEVVDRRARRRYQQ